MGQNPFVRLFVDGEVSALASVWNVEWSPHGAGRSLIVWHGGQAVAVGPDEDLSRWLVEYFTRQFPEAAGLAWDTTRYDRADVAYELDADRGLMAHGGDLRVEIGEPFHRRVFRSDDFALAGVAHSISNVFMPCRTASIDVGGELLKGEPVVSGEPARPSSSAFLALAEVWSTTSS